ncbi:MAG: MFS transporter [Paracoccaceae bacterium]
MGASILFRRRDFGLYWLGLLFVQMATQIQSITIGWQIYGLGRASMTISESAFLVGLVGLAQFLPMFALTLWAGSLADRHSRRAIVVLALLVDTFCVGALVAVALMPAPDYRLIFAIAALFGAARAFLSPASTALVPMLVPVAEMPQAISLKSLSWQFAVIVGPWLGAS